MKLFLNRCVSTWLLVAVCSTTALAQGSGGKAAAQTLFDEGNKLFRAGRFGEACPKLAGAVELYPEGLGARGRLAQCYEKIGKVASSWATWREVAELAAKAGERRRRRVADRKAEALVPRLPYLTIKVSEAARVPGLEVSRAGQAVVVGAFGIAIAVDPGSVKISASAPGHKSWTTVVEIAESEKKTVDVASLEIVEVEIAPVRQPSSAVATDSSASQRSRTMRLAGMTSVGVGSALVGVGAIFGWSAWSKWNDATGDGGGCNEELVCDPTSHDKTQTAATHANYSTGFVVAGAAVAVAGGVLWWLSADGDAATESVTVAPLVSSRDVGFAVSGRF